MGGCSGRRERLARKRLGAVLGPFLCLGVVGCATLPETLGAECTLAAPGDLRGDSLARAVEHGALAATERRSTLLSAELWEAGDHVAAHRVALQEAYLLLYGYDDPRGALAAAEVVMARLPPAESDGSSGAVLADFFVRAGQTERARALLGTGTGSGPGASRVAALLELSGARVGPAIAALKSIEQSATKCQPCVLFDLGIAWDAAGVPDSASAAFQGFLEGPEVERQTCAWAVRWARRRLEGG